MAVNSSNIGVFIIFIIFILLLFFTAAIIIAININIKSTSISINQGLFLASCVTGPCSQPYICDGASFTCKLPQGAICSNYADCVTGLICSGICATGPIGGLNQLCPCNPGYTCITEVTGANLCKGLSGTSCIINSDCASDICAFGVCTAGLPNSYPCIINSDCGSNNCSLGFCQAQGFVSGAIGAACINANCLHNTDRNGASCTTLPDLTVICACIMGTDNPGTCVAA